MRLSRGRLAQACVYPGLGRPEHASIPEPVDPGMRQFGVGRPEHASIPEPVDPGMRLSRSRLARACVYASGIGRLSMRLSRSRSARACVYPGIGRPEHASIPEPVDPGMRLFRGRLAPACVNSGIGRPEHASIPEPVDPSMRQFRGRLAPPCVNSGIGWPKHASIPGSVGLSMRQIRGRLTRACVYFGVGRSGHASIRSRKVGAALTLTGRRIIGAGFALPRDAGRRPVASSPGGGPLPRAARVGGDVWFRGPGGPRCQPEAGGPLSRATCAPSGTRVPCTFLSCAFAAASEP